MRVCARATARVTERCIEEEGVSERARQLGVGTGGTGRHHDHFEREKHGSVLALCANVLLHFVGHKPLRVHRELESHGSIEGGLGKLVVAVAESSVEGKRLPVLRREADRR